MAESFTVSMSGTAFSLLNYEIIKNPNGQEGFLLGHFLEHRTRTITDNDQQQINVARVLRVSTCVPCPYQGYFYDASGEIDPNQLARLLGHQSERVVGWYKFKQVSSTDSLTWRQKVVHKNLTEQFVECNNFFTCCIVTPEVSENSSTNTFFQTFVRSTSLGFEALPLHLINLSEPNDTYKVAQPISETFQEILSKAKLDSSNGINTIKSIQKSAQGFCRKLVTELCKDEVELFRLEGVVLGLVRDIRDREYDRSTIESCDTVNDSLEEDDGEVITKKDNDINKKHLRSDSEVVSPPNKATIDSSTTPNSRKMSLKKTSP